MKNSLHPLDLKSKFGTIKQPLESNFKDGLSVAMIVRNEENHIYDCLKSLILVADEVVINDTGSKDGTLDEVQRFTRHCDMPVHVYQNKWEDDFALARNQAIEKAYHKWVLWIDADDRIPEESIEGINRLKAASLTGIVGFQIINTNGGQPIGSRFVQIRMFPNHPEIRFERRIHEQILPSAARLGLNVIYIPAEIHHTGYENGEEKERKAIRNLRLSNMETERIGIDPSFTMAMGDSYYVLEEWEKGIECYQKCMTIPGIQQIQSDIHFAAPVMMGLGYMILKKHKESCKWFEFANVIDKNRLDPYFYMAKLFRESGETGKAIDMYRKLLKLDKKISSVSTDLDSMRLIAYNDLSSILMHKKYYGQAIDVLLGMEKEYPQAQDAYDGLIACYEILGKDSEASLVVARYHQYCEEHGMYEE